MRSPRRAWRARTTWSVRLRSSQGTRAGNSLNHAAGHRRGRCGSLAHLVSVAYVIGAVWVTVDAVLRKRHVPAIIGWVGLAWLVPVVGALAYFLLGINRIRRSATAMNRRVESVAHGDACVSRFGAIQREVLDARYPGFAGLDRLGERVTRNPLLDGNRVEPLQDGDVAFPDARGH